MPTPNERSASEAATQQKKMNEIAKNNKKTITLFKF